MSPVILTVQPDRAVRFAPRVLGHALVGAVVGLLDVVDVQPHVRLVDRHADRGLCPVFRGKGREKETEDD